MNEITTPPDRAEPEEKQGHEKGVDQRYTKEIDQSSSPPANRLTVEMGIGERIRLNLRLFLKYSRDSVCMVRAVKVALVVGTVIGIINHYDEMLEGTLTGTNYFQMGITYTIPYMVNIFGSARQASHIELNMCLIHTIFSK